MYNNKCRFCGVRLISSTNPDSSTNTTPSTNPTVQKSGNTSPGMKKGSICRACDQQNKMFKDRRKSSTLKMHKKIWESQHGLCAICGDPINFEDGDYEIDHILPINKGGKFCWSNIQLAHSLCNRWKGNLTMDSLELLCEKFLMNSFSKLVCD